MVEGHARYRGAPHHAAHGAALQVALTALCPAASDRHSLGKIMSTTPNDPVQLLASLFKGGQSIFGNPAAGGGGASGESSDAPSHSDPMSGFMAFTSQMAEMQKQFVDQMTGFWSGAMTGAPQA